MTQEGPGGSPPFISTKHSNPSFEELFLQMVREVLRELEDAESATFLDSMCLPDKVIAFPTLKGVKPKKSPPR